MKIYFMHMLFIVFMILKLTGTITWSWWWVTAPLWIPALFATLLVIAVGVIGGKTAIIELSTKLKKNHKK